ncbi:MAG: ABC transporter permease subunit [Planctomycetota bacterium]|nr:ABC transporter permease subunit [Planctomycetota bacterium]
MRSDGPRRPFVLGRRGSVVLVLAALAVVAWFALDLAPSLLVPRAGGAGIAKDFFAAALTPALDYESDAVPSGAPPFLLRLLDALRRTVVFAAAAMSLALVGGIVLGFLASTSWWATDPVRGNALRRSLGPAVQVATRFLIALMRSVHELLWAVIFLAAFGLSTAAAVVALAIPFAGTLAKVFSEILDEAPTDAAFALRSAGAAPAQIFLAGTLPRAAPDMAAYAFYRFECCVRSSAILGFFGYETLGYYLRLSFENLHYREVWTHLYALLALVVVLEVWSSLLRRRFVA